MSKHEGAFDHNAIAADVKSILDYVSAIHSGTGKPSTPPGGIDAGERAAKFARHHDAVAGRRCGRDRAVE